MDYTIIDAHAHLWLRQDTVVDGFPIRTLENGRSLFIVLIDSKSNKKAPIISIDALV